MLTGWNRSVKMSQDSVSPVQYSAVFIIYTNSRNLLGEEQTKFWVLKSNVQSQRKMSKESTSSQTDRHPETQIKKGIGWCKWIF